MNNEQKKDEGRTEPQTHVRPKDDQPKRNKRGALERFARRVEEVAQAEKAPTRSR
jgi:hypothetical protein